MNLSFLNPWGLLALPLTAAPWLLHRWALSKAKPVSFPSLELLRAALKRSFASSFLSHRILLLLRTLLVFFLVAFLSRPVIRGRAASPSDDPLAVVLAFDVSASMGATISGRSRLAWAVDEALPFIEARRPGRRVGVIAFSNRLENIVPPTEDDARLKEELKALRVTPRPTDVSVPFAAALPWFSGIPEGRSSLILLTDGARNGWRNPPPPLPPDLRVTVAFAPVLPSNGALLGIAPADADGAARLLLSGWGFSSPERRGWSVYWNDRPAAQGQILLGNGPKSAVLPSLPLDPSSPGRAVLDPDALSEDDVFYLLPSRESSLRVLAINGAPALAPPEDELYFLRPVLDRLAREGGTVKIVSPEAVGSEDLSRWNVVLAANATLSADTLSRLRRFVADGGGLLATAGDKAPLQGWEGLLPVRLTGRRIPGGRVRPVSSGNPLSRRLSEDGGFEWGNIAVKWCLETVPESGADVLFKISSSDQPLFVVGRKGRGRVASLSTTLDRDWNNLPGRPLYPVLFRELLSFLSGGESDVSASLSVDDPWEGKLPPGLIDPVVQRPDGLTEPVSTRGESFRYEATDLPGLYVLHPRSRTTPRVMAAVNLDRSSGESDPGQMEASEMRSLLSVRNAEWIPPSTPVHEAYLDTVRARPLSVPIVFVLALFFLLETLLLAALRR